MTTTCFGMLNQDKWLPLHLISGGLVLEFELDDADTCFTGTGNSFDLTDVRLYANMHTIDSALANSYASHVLRGNPLTVHFKSVVASRHLVNGSSFDINLVRGFTRLSRIFVVFVQAAGKKVSAAQKQKDNEHK